MFCLSDIKILKIDYLSVVVGESWVFVGSNGSGKFVFVWVLVGDLFLFSG